MRTKLQDAISRRNFLKGSSTAAAAAALPAGLVRSLPADAADPNNPFPHGIASGDPLPDSVMLWTRLNPDFVEAKAAPGQAGVRSKPRCKGCKVEPGPSSSTGRPGCKGCKVERDPASRAAVQTAGVVWEIVTFGETFANTFGADAPKKPRDPLTMSDADFETGSPAATGSVTASVANDYTVKIDVTGLAPGTYYYYRFSHAGVTSPIARTKTLSTDPLSARIALVSCSSIPHGYFNAYGALAGLGDNSSRDPNNFDDVDVVLCLGDYIYEYAQGCYPEGGPVRTNPEEPAQPLTEMVSLSDYRTRHRQYKSDPELQALHRKFPMVNVWDDHEATDNAYPNGANNHTPVGEQEGPTDPNDPNWAAHHCNQGGGGRDEGDWPTRLNAAQRSYFEYLPVRPDPSDPFRLYRKFQFGNLADLFMLDTRLEREGPGCATNPNPPEGAEACGMDDLETIGHPDRYLLGMAQQQWLSDELSASTAKWQLLGQQIMVGQLRVVPNVISESLETPLELTGIPGFSFDPTGFADSEGVIFITDLWDGWQASRERLYEVIKAKNEDETNPGNVVVLTGDIHTSWANDIHPNPASATSFVPVIPGITGIDNYDKTTGEGSLAVEFVCPSITSHGLPELEPIQEMIRTVNPHVQYVDLAKHGFVILDVMEERVTGTWHFVGKDAEVSQRDATYAISDSIAFSCDAGQHHLNETCPPAGPCSTGVQIDRNPV